VAKPFRKQARPDFDALRVPIMWWCLRVKLACHLRNFTRHLLFTRDRPIVEDSARDAFWGAKAVQGNAELLRGQNVLGRMLVLLRELLRQHGEEALARIEPPPIPDFLLLGRAIGVEEGRV
jgi:predicted NAD-dependent protein-ADP-ribosyltransferase YbiA (DUF1768 family)